MADRKAFIMLASNCPEFDNNKRDGKQINALADKYCFWMDKYDESNHEDEEAQYWRDCYYAALALKFWDQMRVLYEKTKTVGTYDYDDFVSILYERINYACKYRAWQKVDEKTGKAKVNAQQCINQAIATEVKNIFYFANLDKYKAGTAAHSVSMEETIAGEGEDDLTWADVIPDENQHPDHSDQSSDIVQMYVNDKKLVEAVILDTIANNDCMKYTKETVKDVDSEGNPYKYVKTHSEFWPYKCVQLLGQLPDDYLESFSDRYDCVLDEMKAAIDKIRTAPNTKLYKYLNATLGDAKKNLANY